MDEGLYRAKGGRTRRAGQSVRVVYDAVARVRELVDTGEITL